MSDQIIEMCEAIARLEVKIETLTHQFNDLMANHLPHLEEEIESLKKFKWQVVAIVSGAMAVLQIAFRYILK